ncbi:replicative DNA helicase [Candidatus Peregrinibacteria bacterium]|nr:replicative DNA helicase [Candidatus Peregrinibacteria bacterium]
MNEKVNFVPPNSLEAEKSTLGAMLIDKDAVVKISDFLRAEDFYHDAHKTIYQAILDLYDKRVPIDLITLSNILEERKELKNVGGASYLALLANEVPTATHIFQYATIVKEKSILRRLIKAGDTIKGLGYKEDGEIEELLDSAEKTLFSVSQTFLSDRFVHIKDILNHTYEKISDLHDPEAKEKYRGIPTGFKSLDGLLSGLQPSDLVILAARPSMGKTALALNIGQNVAKKGYAVGVISLEMSKEQLVERMFCSLLGVDSWKMRTGKLTDDDFAKMGAVMDELNSMKIYIDDSIGNSIAELKAKARRLKMESGLDFLIIDYLQLMTSGLNSFQANRVQEISEISRSLKALARDLHVPILALSQLSRAVELRPSKIPQLSDLRESGCLTGDTLVVRADTGERVPIKSLLGQRNIPVWSLNTSYKLEQCMMTKVFSSGYKKTFEMRTRSGHSIKASANHPFLSIKGWKPLEYLAKGVHIAIPRVLDLQNTESSMSDNELILLAHLIGDGCVLPMQPIHYTSADIANCEIVEKTANELFAIKPRRVKQKNWWHVYLPSPYRLARGKRNPISNWYQNLGLFPVRSYEKVLPASLFQASNRQIQLFLHHLWATDGNISWKKLDGRKLNVAVYYASTSKILAEQVQHLLLRLGIFGTLRISNKVGYRPVYQVHVQGATYLQHFLKSVGCYGKRGENISLMLDALADISPNPNNDVIPKEAWASWIEPIKQEAGISWREFSKRMDMSYCGDTLFKSGLSCDRMTRAAVALKSKPLLQIAQSDIYWDEIVEIKELQTEEVFDATVPDTHNFVANDFIVHNSIEQDSDVVIMMYREDYYEEDTERKGITDLFIRKHRNGPTGHFEMVFKKAQLTFLDIEKQRKAEDYAGMPQY